MTTEKKTIAVINMKQYAHTRIGCCEDCCVVQNSGLCYDLRTELDVVGYCPGHWTMERNLTTLEVAEAAIALVRDKEYASCTALKECGADETLLEQYRKHSNAKEYFVGFSEYSEAEWDALTSDEKREIRIERLTGFVRSSLWTTDQGDPK